MTEGDESYNIVQNIGDNGYKIKLAGEMNSSGTFNIRDVTLYIEDENKGHEDLRANPLQGGG